MYALITGATSGIGLEFAKKLSEKYDLILVSRNTNSLEEFKNECKNNVILESLDLTEKNNCHLLYEKYKDYDIDLLINNAGFGKIGFLSELDIIDGEKMIELNVLALYSLTHLFLNVVKSNILNVGSIAAFCPGPKMANYYATKSYVVSFTRALNYELKREKKKLRVSVLCPGPVKTNFNNVAKGDFKLKGQNPDAVVKKAIKKMNKKTIIYPSIFSFLMAIFSKIIPHRFIYRIIYNNQNSK